MRVQGVRAWLVACVCAGLVAGCAQAGALRVIAAYEEPAPGDTGAFLNFAQGYGVDPAISGQNIAFAAATEESGGYYAYMDGELRVIVDTTTPVPDRDHNFGFAVLEGSSPSISGRNVAFASRSGIEGGSIWGWFDGELVRIADAPPSHRARRGGSPASRHWPEPAPRSAGETSPSRASPWSPAASTPISRARCV